MLRPEEDGDDPRDGGRLPRLTSGAEWMVEDMLESPDGPWPAKLAARLDPLCVRCPIPKPPDRVVNGFMDIWKSPCMLRLAALRL